MSDDVIEIEILPDGTIRTSTDLISAVNHRSADQFLTDMQRDAGGTTDTKKKRVTHSHAHDHIHEHA